MSTPIRPAEAVLVIVDISGYTQFVHKRNVSLEHAEAIVTELIESIIDQAEHPLVVNKLEGAAALLFAETRGERKLVVASAIRQVAQFLAVFARCLAHIRESRRHCDCDACANIGVLQLKAFMHLGDIVIKKVRTFEEIAGDPVILVHRMTKNAVPLHEYVLLTEAIVEAGGSAIGGLQTLRETIDGLRTTLHWCPADAIAPFAGELPAPARAGVAARGSYERTLQFRNLPGVAVAHDRVQGPGRLGRLLARWWGR